MPYVAVLVLTASGQLLHSLPEPIASIQQDLVLLELKRRASGSGFRGASCVPGVPGPGVAGVAIRAATVQSRPLKQVSIK